MRLLLDTHLLLWSMAASHRLKQQLRRLLTDPQNTVFYSAASIWEISIKNALGRKDFKVEVSALLKALSQAGFTELAVSASHAAAVAALPGHHKDPFDRMLVAQANEEALVLLTNDAQLERYGAQVQLV